MQWQSQQHIKPLHQHFAIRLVLEGGFLPEEITPHPPLRAESRKGELTLVFDPSVQNQNEETLLGGLKTKNVDVVVQKRGIGPVIAISVKGTLNAFRNLTNRMEEAVGDATNLHLMYPGLVYGFFHVLKANRAGTAGIALNDVAVTKDGTAVGSITRYHTVLLALTGRLLVRDEFSRYESVALALIDPIAGPHGHIFPTFPTQNSRLRPENFFPSLLERYDLRFPYVAASIRHLNRVTWPATSPALVALGPPDQWERILGYQPRVS